jgi:hypothetical protein
LAANGAAAEAIAAAAMTTARRFAFLMFLSMGAIVGSLFL